VDLADDIHPNGVDPTPNGVDWGSLIWPGGRPSGDSQVLADRAAAAAAVAARAGSDSGAVALAERPVMVRALTDEERAEPEFEPWNPEATYDSLVRILTELKAMNPEDVAVLPRRRRPLGGFRVSGRAVAAVLVLALAVAAVTALVARHGGSKPKATVAVAPRTYTTLVTLESGNSVEGAMLLARTGNKTQEILLPSRLLVDVPGQGSAPLAQAPLSGPDATADAVSNALHVRIDGTWVLDPTSLAVLVDAEGGVDVTLTDDVLPTDGSVALSFGVGASHLNGAQAGQLALAIGSQEPEASRLARQQILLEAVFGKLPADAGSLSALLQGAKLQGQLTATSLATMLAGVRVDVQAQRASSIVVPTTEIDSGSGTPSYGLDDQATQAMVDDRLSGAEFPVPAGGRARVLVQNGIGTPGLGDLAREQLVPRGYIFRSGGNAAAFGTGPSVVLIPDSTAASRALGSTVAQLLGLPATAVQLDVNQTTIADVVVILGSDFKAPAATPSASAASAP
jgi:anionic cell wall polymer biosynthesis LytR-Cps2A-Psr (LCP) family protein